MRALTKHLTFANVCSGLSLFLVLSAGTAYGVVHLGANSVKSKNIAPNAVKGSDIADGAVTAPKIAAGAVTGAAIAPGAVTSADIGPGAIGGTQVASGAIGQGQLAAGAVGSSQLAGDAVKAENIAADSVDASKIPDAPSGSDAVDANTLDGFSSFDFQLGDGADQVTQAAALEFGEESEATVLASGIMTLKCGATPTLEFEDYAEDNFETDAWDPTHTTIADGASHSFVLPTNGMKFLEIYGAGGDFIAVSSFVSGSTCTMIANSTTNFGSVLSSQQATAPALKQFSRQRAARR